MTGALSQAAILPPGPGVPTAAVFDTYLQQVEDSFDPIHGGFGLGPKFPAPMDLGLLLRLHRRSGDPATLAKVTHSLDTMMDGGLYDHVGGGFHRYTVDPAWRVPHFEKMLYTNALLITTYLEAYQVTGEPAYARVARESCDYVLRDMVHLQGGFFSAEDADSDGVEGRFYVWTPSELEAALGTAEARLFGAAYDVAAGGNWEGEGSILHRVEDDDALARQHETTPADIARRLEGARQTLLVVRAGRPRPLRDDKVLTAWNGLMIAALSQAHQILDEPRYRDAAVRAAEFVLSRLHRDNRLLRRWRAGEAAVGAHLTDYAFLIHGLIDLYEATFEPRWLIDARSLNEAMVARFSDPSGGFFDTDGTDPTLLFRNKDRYDGTIPTGNAIACLNLLRLAEYFGEERFRALAEKGLRAFHRPLTQTPRILSQLLQALDFHLSGAREIVIVGPPHHASTRELLATVRQTFRPAKVVALTSGEDGVARTIPWAANRPAVGGVPTAYVCQNSVCQRPVQESADLLKQLLP
jgi:uncharacterized protein YyaL (SSP411 family)